MPPSSRYWLRAAFSVDSAAGSSSLLRLPPAFLCPAVWATLGGTSWQQPRAAWRQVGSQRRCVSNAAAAAAYEAVPDALRVAIEDAPTPAASAPAAAARSRKLPLQCPGCGAYSQTTQPDLPGYFDLGRRSTMEYLGLTVREKPRVREDDRVVEEALRRVDREALESQGVDLRGLLWETDERQVQEREFEAADEDGRTEAAATRPSILCRRCHDLVHHSAGAAIYHPDIDAVRETIAESPYKYNYVYHILDAADFPMSLLPRIHELLDTMPLRSRNRRSRHGKFYGNRKTELSFVITRADLLAPHKQQVDRLMPWIRETLRDALGRMGRHVRLGNVRCVSAQRNWWTTELREEIWERGGASWLVGKANVGKSYLVHHVFPKGRMDTEGALVKKQMTPLLALEWTESGTYRLGDEGREVLDDDDTHMEGENLDEAALLPPRPAETNYPQMPVVSALAGTTASPIRIPFGSGRGELIDLPGLVRTGLAEAVAPQHREALVMKVRVQPEQEVLKGPWQSLLLGGVVRITPRTPDVVFLAYNFTPLPAHRTMTDKAVAIQQQTSELRVPNLAPAGAGADMRLAGSFALCHDVTRLRAGPITRRDAANIPVDRLPYRVVALDLLIEGCGWVEVVAQVRTRHLFRRPEAAWETERTERTERSEERRREADESKTKSKAETIATETGKFKILQTLDLSAPEEAETTSPSPRQQRGSSTRVRGKQTNDVEAQAPVVVMAAGAADYNWPIIDVFSPGGKFVGSRRPLNAWMMCRPSSSSRKSKGSRPRRR